MSYLCCTSSVERSEPLVVFGVNPGAPKGDQSIHNARVSSVSCRVEGRPFIGVNIVDTLTVRHQDITNLGPVTGKDGSYQRWLESQQLEHHSYYVM